MAGSRCPPRGARHLGAQARPRYAAQQPSRTGLTKPAGCISPVRKMDCLRRSVSEPAFHRCSGGHRDSCIPTESKRTLADSKRGSWCSTSSTSPGVSGSVAYHGIASSPLQTISLTPSWREGSNRTPVLRAADRRADQSPSLLVMSSGDSDDFVEGGVELPPAPNDNGSAIYGRYVSGGGADLVSMGRSDSPVSIMPLPEQPTDKRLEVFWPPGQGLRALFLDYDGTLRALERRPELATPTRELLDLLALINRSQDLLPHIVSGRDAAFLERHFGHLDRFTLLAEHGFQIWRPGNRRWESLGHRYILDNDQELRTVIRREMDTLVRECPGSFVEEKTSSLVWHCREVQRDQRLEAQAPLVARAVERLERLRDTCRLEKIRISSGHQMVEASLRTIRKGPAMRRIIEDKALFGQPFLSVLVAGDDQSDESMFDLAAHDVLTVKVGSAPTRAKFRVDSPEGLCAFLWKLASCER